MCDWRNGLKGDKCDVWTANTAWHVSSRTISLAIFLAVGLHTGTVLAKATGYQRRYRRTRSALGACAPSHMLCTLWSTLAASCFACAHFSFALASVCRPDVACARMRRMTEGELSLRSPAHARARP